MRLAIYHLHAKVISRGDKRSAVAAAAYRAAECLMDERLGRAQNFRAKTGVVHREVMLPPGAPARWSDRATLWNEVEQVERRCDAALAREVEIALPRELGRVEAVRLAQDYVREQFVGRGMVADLVVHWPVDGDGLARPHLHAMLSTRGVVPGPAGHPEAGRFGLKELAWKNRVLLLDWRARWAELANERLAESGHDVRIDHRSHKEQGIGLEPQNKVGPAGARRAWRGEAAERADEHRDIARRNGEAVLADPTLLLDAITAQQSTFTRAELRRWVAGKTADAAQAAEVLARVEACPELVQVGRDGRGRARLSTRVMVAAEQALVSAAAELNGRTRHPVALARRQAALAGTAADGVRLGEEQAAAFGHLTRSRDLVVLAGIAGGGKSTLLGAARRAWEAEGYRVQGAALSGIAAEGLESGSGIASRTIAGLEHAWQEGREALGARDVLVVDEAGMVGSRQLGRLAEAARASGAKLVLVGDAEQLQAIEAGAAFRAVAERVGHAGIVEPKRQHAPWQREATKELASGRTALALDRYEAAGMMHAHLTDEAAAAGVVAGWDAGRRAHPGRSRIVLTHTRVAAQALNERVRALRHAAGELGPDHLLQTERGPRRFAAGDRVYFLRNDRVLGVKNGTLGTLERIEAVGPAGAGAGAGAGMGADGTDGAAGASPLPETRLVVRLDGGRAVPVRLAEYAHLDHGYAATVHKGQGVTVDEAHVLATPGMDRHLAYVALSRHRHAAQLHWSAEAYDGRAALAAQLGRERAKDTTLDYGGDGGTDGAAAVDAYAGHRGLDPLRPVSGIVVPPELLREPAAPVPPASVSVSVLALPPVPGPALPPVPAPPPVQVRPLNDVTARLQASNERLAALAPGSGHRLLQEQRAGAALARVLPAMSESLRELGQAMAGMVQVLERQASGGLAQRVAEAVAAACQATGTNLVLEHGQERNPRRDPGPPAPMLPAVPCQPITTAEVAAAVSADKAVRDARASLAYALERAYRDPDGAARRLALLEAEPGGDGGIAAELARRPGVLGRLRGSGSVFAGDGAVERHFALEAAGKVGTHLAAQRQAEREAERAYRLPIEERRRGEAVEVPGLSPQAWRVVEALRDRGTAPHWTWLQPWDEPRPPTEQECSIALRVAPVWAAVVADPGLRDELAGFMAAADSRLDGRLGRRRDGLTWPEEGVDTLRGLLTAAEALYGRSPMFERHAAGEDRRQAVAARLAAEQEVAAEREAAAAGPVRELEAMRGRLLADGIEAWWRRERPWVAPHRRGEAPAEVRDGLRRELAAPPLAELRKRDAKLARRGPLREWEPPRAGSAGPSPGM